MIVLVGTSQAIVASLAGAPATSQPIFFCSFVNGQSWLGGESADGVLSGASTVEVVPAGADGIVRQLWFLSIQNADTAVVMLTLRFDRADGAREIWKGVLNPGSTLFYRRGRGFHVLDSAGRMQASAA